MSAIRNTRYGRHMATLTGRYTSGRSRTLACGSFACACSPLHITLRPEPAAAPQAARSASKIASMIHLSISACSVIISLPRCESLTSLCRRE